MSLTVFTRPFTFKASFPTPGQKKVLLLLATPREAVDCWSWIAYAGDSLVSLVASYDRHGDTVSKFNRPYPQEVSLVL